MELNSAEVVSPSLLWSVRVYLRCLVSGFSTSSFVTRSGSEYCLWFPRRLNERCRLCRCLNPSWFFLSSGNCSRVRLSVRPRCHARPSESDSHFSRPFIEGFRLFQGRRVAAPVCRGNTHARAHTHTHISNSVPVNSLCRDPSSLSTCTHSL